MSLLIKKSTRISDNENYVIMASKPGDLDPEMFSIAEFEYLKKQADHTKKDFILLNRLDNLMIVIFEKPEMNYDQRLEQCRGYGDKVAGLIQEHAVKKIVIQQTSDEAAFVIALAEGIALGSYRFLKYKKDQNDKQTTLKEIAIRSKTVTSKLIDHLTIIIDAVTRCRNLINEPLSYLTAEKLSEEITEMGLQCGAHVEVLNKKKIEALKMGGLLAVNRGSIEPPTFTIMEYKPEKPVNSKPIVLVGKGVVFDTGGINIKTYEGMMTMKDDMSGAAAVVCSLYAVAKAELPVHVIALIPATENRPSGNAYVPGDILTMYDGTTVEVLNTDAEGRLILADALAYAKKYDPSLVIDICTLTGAAAIAIGRRAMVGMKAGSDAQFIQLTAAGNRVYERIVEFPMWEDYGEMMKSDIADLKNIGGRDSGAITAAKFLEHFTSYPWIHLDIAGPAFIEKRDSYRGSGGTGVGVRLLFELMLNFVEK